MKTEPTQSPPGVAPRRLVVPAGIFERPENPPAFPQASPEMVIPGQSALATQGMTLRDYFAAKIINGLLNDANIYDNQRFAASEDYASISYRIADAMLAERQKGSK